MRRAVTVAGMKRKRMPIVLIAAVVLLAGLGVAGVALTSAWRGDGGGAAHRAPNGPSGWDARTRQLAEKAHSRAQALIDRSQFAKARAVLAKHLDEVPDDGRGHLMLAQALIGQGRLDRAYTAANTACEIGDTAEAHFSAGSLAQKLDRPKTARRHYERAAEIEPEQVKYPLYLANLLLAMGEMDDAERVARRVLTLAPGISRAHYILGEVEVSRGNLDAGVAHIDQALDLVKPDSLKHLIYKLTRARWLRGGDDDDKLEALQTLTSLPDALLQRNRTVVDEIAITLDSLGKAGEAAQLWSDWLNEHRDDAAAAAQAGLYWMEAGNRDKANELLNAARRIKPYHPLVKKLEGEIGDDRRD